MHFPFIFELYRIIIMAVSTVEQVTVECFTFSLFPADFNVRSSVANTTAAVHQSLYLQHCRYLWQVKGLTATTAFPPLHKIYCVRRHQRSFMSAKVCPMQFPQTSFFDFSALWGAGEGLLIMMSWLRTNSLGSGNKNFKRLSHEVVPLQNFWEVVLKCLWYVTFQLKRLKIIPITLIKLNCGYENSSTMIKLAWFFSNKLRNKANNLSEGD